MARANILMLNLIDQPELGQVREIEAASLLVEDARRYDRAADAPVARSRRVMPGFHAGEGGGTRIVVVDASPRRPPRLECQVPVGDVEGEFAQVLS